MSGSTPLVSSLPGLVLTKEGSVHGGSRVDAAESGQPEWLLFTPGKIDRERCMARTFAHGKGGQCPRKQVGGGRFCGSHVKKQVHGAVDGPVPEDKLLEFRKCARLRSVGSAGSQASVEVGDTIGATSSHTVDPVLAPSSRREDMRRARQSRVVAPRRTQIATMGNVLAENKFVEREMKRRNFQMREGQWVGGLLLPGDPTDDAQLESFLRRQFQAPQEEARVAAWGQGRTLGRG